MIVANNHLFPQTQNGWKTKTNSQMNGYMTWRSSVLKNVCEIKKEQLIAP